MLRFYVEVKWSSIDESQYEIYACHEHWMNPDDIPDQGYGIATIGDCPMPWTAELKTLLEVNLLYRKWSSDESRGEDVPDEIISLLKSITHIDALLCNLGEYVEIYPGLEEDNYRSDEIISISGLSFPWEEDDAVDLDAIAANESGITPRDLFRIIPSCKWLSGYLTLPLTMTPEQIAHEESSEGEQWWYIRRDVHFRIADILIAKGDHFSREKEDS